MTLLALRAIAGTTGPFWTDDQRLTTSGTEVAFLRHQYGPYAEDKTTPTKFVIQRLTAVPDE